MIWALLALLGVPIWLVAVVLVAVLRNRAQVRRTEGVFRYWGRSHHGWSDHGWSRRAGHARWVSDVLLQHSGPGLARIQARQATDVRAVGRPEHPPRRADADAVELVVVFADGTEQRFAVAGRSIELAIPAIGVRPTE